MHWHHYHRVAVYRDNCPFSVALKGQNKPALGNFLHEGKIRFMFWQHKVVTITGASSGIGAALAKHLAERGAAVGLIARRERLLAEITDALHAAGHRAAFAVADVASVVETRAAVERLEKSLGSCHVAIACAGVYRKTSGARFSADVANDQFATNVNGVSNLFDAVLPGMLQRRSGHLAAVSSIGAMLGLPGAAAYCGSKAAVVTMLQSLRLDLHDHGIRVTTLCPGFVDTAMITDEERKTLRCLLTAEQAAAKMARAIERGRAEAWFPWPTWLEVKLASLLPAPLLRAVMKWFGEMEETT